MGPNVRISAISAAPVAKVFASKARPTFPPQSRSAMMPDPTTVATRSPVPSASEVTRLARATLGLDCGLALALLNENLPVSDTIAKANI